MNELEFNKHIKATFRIEAEEHINAFKKGLYDLENKYMKEEYAEIVELMFREIHSLKGAARSVNQQDIESICQPLEDVFSALKHNEVSVSALMVDLFYKVAELLKQLILDANTAQPISDKQAQREIIEQLKNCTSQNPILGDLDNSNNYNSPEAEVVLANADLQLDTPFTAKVENSINNHTIRINAAKLDQLMLQAEEFIQEKNTINQRIIDFRLINTDIIEWQGSSVNNKTTKSKQSTQFDEEPLAAIKINFCKLENQFAEFNHALERDRYNLHLMVDNHLESVRNLLMQPVSTLVESFPGMVRKLAGELGKQIEFTQIGTELEIDKRILEELKDPLIHLIRNSIDHGIGKPNERVLHQKPEKGNLKLEFVRRENGKVEIILSDDGSGINRQKVLKAAIKNGYFNEEAAEKLNDNEILPLIFESGISTSAIITEVSGRGLGLAIVKEKVENLNGSISVETELNKGTTFRLLLPVSLSSVRGILVRCGEFMFIIPTKNVERVLKINEESIKTIENHKTICLENQVVAVALLGDVLSLSTLVKQKGATTKLQLKNTPLHMVVLVSGEHRMAFIVDEVLGEQQVLVKSMGKLLKRVRNISGATILGSGKAILVLYVPDLVKSAITFTQNDFSSEPLEKAPEKIKNILVAEDSITSRTLLKNILETAGYNVTTAFDGIDAYAKASTLQFDLIVSDVDMPRMNGFEFITKIKNNNKLKHIPVVMITALGSRDDRERGIEAGADAYIIKSSFDQFGLIQIIKKLI